MYYFNYDGSYGKRTADTEQFNIAVPTSNWNKYMWELVDSCADTQRFKLACHFNVNVHTIAKGKCKDCELTAEQLSNQHVVDNSVKDGEQWVSLSQESYLGGAHPNSW